ncbi:cytochrome P450 [Streptomyces roseoverticillatus]|uniref:hypothetical protein n=1 Tax=Streptomyces roseoverticillatus TaxID=66429 RepID=UPI001F47134E|nr:hypothetical protein [Streptomyces roseoverticillatus]MCF3101811.1 cytochrome P450 [Streptomyces roseoverticillatus]
MTMHDQSPPRAETWPTSRTCPFSPPPDYAGMHERPGLPRPTGPSGRTVFVEHGPARRAVAGEFAIRRIQELRLKVQCIVDGLLNGLLGDVPAGAEPADLVSAPAVPMSGPVLCELLGIPASDRQEFITNTTVLTAHDSAEADRAESFRSLIAYFDALCATKMTERPEDLLGRLAGHQFFSGGESRRVMVELCICLVVAGLETTATMTALGVLAPLEHPDQLALGENLAHPHSPPGHAMRRTALRQRLRVLGIGAPGHLVTETKSAGRQPCVHRVTGEAVRFVPIKFRQKHGPRHALRTKSLR